MRSAHVLALLGSVSIIAFAAPAFAAAPEPASAGANNVQEVVVTANKREEIKRDVAMSITAVGGGTLEKLQDRNFQDYAPLIPGLSINSTGQGETRLTLRGTNAGGVASTVSVYVDETPQGSSSGLVDASTFAGEYDTFDMQRVEVLRGPQGTLYGANSEGGLLKFVTRPPNPDRYEGSASLGANTVTGGSTGWTARGMANVPVGDRAAFRISGYHEQAPGWVDDVRRKVRDVNRGDKDGVRIGALWRPVEALTIRLSAFGQDAHFQGTPEVDVNPTTLEPTNGGLTQRRYRDEPRNFRYRNYSGTVAYDLGWATAQSVTSWGQIHNTTTTDYSALVFAPPSLTLEQLLTGALGTPAGGFLINRVNLDKFTQEFRLTSPKSDRLEWQAGVYFTREKGLIDQDLSALAVPSGVRLPLPALQLATVNSTYKEWAVFGDATWHFSPRFDVQVGARYSDNKQLGTETSSGLLVGPVSQFSTPSSENVFNYSVAPRWKLSEQTMIYARVATGYRPGGPNVLPPAAPPSTPRQYQSDSTTNYELGLKTASADGRVSIDLAAFLIDWRRIQILEVVNHFGVNANAGTARSQGIEFEGSFRPIPRLTLSLTGAYTVAELRSDAPSIGGLSGDQLPWTPHYSGALDAERLFTAPGGYQGFVGGTLAYVGDRYSDYSSGAAGPGRTHVPGFSRLDLRAGVDVARFRLEVYAKNLGDTRGLVALSGPGTAPLLSRSAGYIQPQTFGAVLSARF